MIISVDVVGELAKIRSGVVYSSIEGVIDELIQNTQRAKATTVWVTLHGDTLTIQDDGQGCPDLSLLFHKNRSGWGSDVHSPFGEGFFSTFSIADTIFVHSGCHTAFVDVEKILTTGNVEVSSSTSSAAIPGFYVELTGRKILENSDRLLSYMKKLGQQIPLRVWLNGELLPKIDITRYTEGSVYKEYFDNKFFYGELAIVNNVWGNVNCFYEYRRVTDISKYHVAGNIHIKPGMVKLKSPDRRAFIHDDQYEQFMSALNKCIHTMFKHFIARSDAEELAHYAEPVAYYCNVKDYIWALDLTSDLFGPEQEEQQKQIGQMASNQSGGWSNQPQQQEPEYEDPFVVPAASGFPAPARRRRRTLKSLKRMRRVCWVLPHERESFEVKQLEKYGFKVLLAKHRLYEMAYKELGIPHYNDIERLRENVVTVTNLEPTSKKERRLRWLLDVISEHLGSPGFITIGDVIISETIRMGEVQYITEKKDVFATIWFDENRLEYRLVLNRRQLNLRRMSAAGSSKISKTDLLFMLSISTAIANELSLYFSRGLNGHEENHSAVRYAEHIAEALGHLGQKRRKFVK